MKQIDKNELYENLSGFLKSKGIELQDGSYANRIRRGCELLADTVNATQKTAKRAKVEVTKKLDQLRQSIHEATAPTPPRTAPAPTPSTTSKPAQAKAKAQRRAKPSASRARVRRGK